MWLVPWYGKGQKSKKNGELILFEHFPQLEEKSKTLNEIIEISPLKDKQIDLVIEFIF